MLFSEKMSRIPQPRRADLWKEYQTLCTVLSLRAGQKKTGIAPAEADLIPLRHAAKNANTILSEFGMSPSFFPEDPDFYAKLLAELDAIMAAPAEKD